MTKPPASEAEKAFNAMKAALADRIRHDARLSASTRAIGAEICSLMNFKTGYCWAAEDYFEEKLGMGLRTVKRGIAALRETGHIVVEKVGRKNRYRAPTDASGQVPIWPLSDQRQGPKRPASGEERGQKIPDRGQKGPPIGAKKDPLSSLEISLGILAPADAGASGAPDGAAGPEFDLGVPGVLLRQRLGDDVFRSWLGKVAVVSIADGELTLSAPTRFLASYIKTNYEAQILECWRLERGGIDRLRVTVVEPAVVPISRRQENPDARWLVDDGIGLVADRLHATREKADKKLRTWLQRCGRDVAGLRRIIEQAAALDLDEVQFSNVVKQRTKALLNAEQQPLEFMRGPVSVKRSAS